MNRYTRLIITLSIFTAFTLFFLNMLLTTYDTRRRSHTRNSYRTPRLTVSDLEREARAAVPAGAKWIYWEHQDWESGGGRVRLTIWADGRSEVRFHPRTADPRFVSRQPEPGWVWTEEGGKGFFLFNPAFPPDTAAAKFRDAFRLGIQEVRPVRRTYFDGQGIEIGICISGEIQTRIFPEFQPEHRGGENHVRFQALSRLLGEFTLKTKAFTEHTPGHAPRQDP